MIVSIRRIKEDENPWISFTLKASSQEFSCVRDHNLSLIFGNATKIEIRLDQINHLARLVDKIDVSSAAGNCFNTHRAGTRAQVEKSRAFNLRRDNVEKSLAQPV